MNLHLSIQPEAADEANEAFLWYESHQPGLGAEFYRELARCIEFLLEHPMLARIVYRNVRKRRLDRFPYSLIYRIAGNELSVISIFHGSRNPKAWKKRARNL